MDGMVDRIVLLRVIHFMLVCINLEDSIYGGG